MNPPEYILPHSDFGAPECSGLLLPIECDDLAGIICNEFGAIVQTSEAGDLSRTLDEMQLMLDVASERCPHCGSINLLPGFSRMGAFTCRSCWEGAVVKAR